MSRLEDINKPFRECAIVRNDYNLNDEYKIGHPDSISDGDELGKDDNGKGTVGSATDIKMREKLMVKNKYNNNRGYCSGTA